MSFAVQTTFTPAQALTALQILVLRPRLPQRPGAASGVMASCPLRRLIWPVIPSALRWALPGMVAMWVDNETDTDFLNFSGVADTVAEIIYSANARSRGWDSRSEKATFRWPSSGEGASGRL